MTNLPFWIAGPALPADSYAALRGTFTLEQAGVYRLRLLGASWYCAWCDGIFVAEGPLRFPPAHPEYQEIEVNLPAGRHVLALKVASYGVETRILLNLPPFLWACLLDAVDDEVNIKWCGIEFPGHLRTGRRINGQLGWVEYLDKRKVVPNWKDLEFAGDWPAAEPVSITELGEPASPRLGAVKTLLCRPHMLAQGLLAETFGYHNDDPPAQFYLRDLSATTNPAQGIWKRYDLGRVRLAKPNFEIDAPAGVMIQFGYAECLYNGRVGPWINLSVGLSCNMDLFITREGQQTLCPLQPKGMRFVEVHVIGANASQVRFLSEEFLERTYHSPAEGGFECSDPLLNKIWFVGVETYRACTEDAVIDNPTRERGQWTGDVVTVGMDVCAVAYRDLRLIRRGLVQSAQCTREDGLVASLSPGGVVYFTSYAAQWTNACIHYWQLTGERALLEELWPHARANMAAFERHRNENGIADEVGPAFIDWGYKRNPGSADLAFNMHYLNALSAMVQWASVLELTDIAGEYSSLRDTQKSALLKHLPASNADLAAWENFGYHNTVLAFVNGMVSSCEAPLAIAYLKHHILDCFPNHPDAPRNAAPEVAQPRLITPYFAHFSFPVLLEHGEMEFVLNQYRKCWGWALEGDRTTWVEVFDTRWTHCHQWAGCPTWQLSRYGLGLHARYDLDHNTFDLKLMTGSLAWARGSLPLPGAGAIHIEWKKAEGLIVYHISTTEAITVRVWRPGDQEPCEISIEDQITWELDLAGRLSATVTLMQESD